MTAGKRLQYRLEALVLRACLAVLRLLGPTRASNLGGLIARNVGPLLPVTKVGDANLQAALPGLDADGRRAVLRGVWDNLGRTVAELPYIGDLVRTAEGPGWEVIGAEHVLPIAAKPGPAILFSGHIGNWEMLPAMARHFGIKLSSFYRAPANPEVDAIIAALRSAPVGDVPNFAKGSQGARAALGYLARGGRLGMLIDQKMNDGIASPLFGRMAMTAPAAAAFALRYRCPLLPAHTIRIGPARVRLIVEAPLDLPDTGDRQLDIQILTDAINARLEEWVRAQPSDWLWLHRRWPKSPSEVKDRLAPNPA